jgi:hypothetical protein
MGKRKASRLTKTESAIVAKHFNAYLEGRESCEVALEQAIVEVREHVLKTFEVHIGGDPTRVFVDGVAKAEFLVLIHKLRGQR